MPNELTNNYHCYSKSVSGNLNLTNNFKVREFACQDGSDPIIINHMVPAVCQAVRNWFGYAFTPTSSYRTVSHNAKKEVGGAARSLHIYGDAVDIPVGGDVTPKELYDFLDRLLGHSCEVGLYSWGCHVGIQDTKKRFIHKSYKG